MTEDPRPLSPQAFLAKAIAEYALAKAHRAAGDVILTREHVRRASCYLDAAAVLLPRSL